MNSSGCITHCKEGVKDLSKDGKFCMFQFLGEQQCVYIKLQEYLHPEHLCYQNYIKTEGWNKSSF